MQSELDRLAQQYPGVVKRSRGLGFMLGLELVEKIPALAASDKPAAIQFVNRLHAAGVLTIPAGMRRLCATAAVAESQALRGRRGDCED